MKENEPVEEYVLRKEKIIKSIDDKIKILLQKMENLRERYVNGFVDEDKYLYLIVPLDKKLVNLKRKKRNLRSSSVIKFSTVIC